MLTDLMGFDFIQKYFIYTTIRTANGLRYRKDNGIASGSYFTQIIGSIFNYILIQWMTLKFCGNHPTDILVQKR